MKENVRAWINRFDKYDRTGAVGGGMFVWLPSLTIFLVDSWLPSRIVSFLILIGVLSLIGVIGYLKLEDKIRPDVKIALGVVGWLLSFCIILIAVNAHYNK
jgi:uncharacterized MnhB-related membrane protein